MRDHGLSPALAALAAGAKREQVPPFAVEIAKPDLRPWREGNALPGVWTFSAAASGPHIAVAAVVHGNEIAGAAVLFMFGISFVALGYLGTQLPTPAYTIISQVCTLLYFSFFLLMPWWSAAGRFKPVPTRLTFTPH